MQQPPPKRCAPRAEPTRRLGLLDWSIVVLCLTACVLGLSARRLKQDWDVLSRHLVRLVQEEVMQDEEDRLASSLFHVAADQKRFFVLTATAYCPLCGTDEHQESALGGLVQPGRTVAVSRDLRRFLGRTVYIRGLGLRMVEDLMHPRFSKRIDLCLPSRAKAMAFGVQRLEVVVVD